MRIHKPLLGLARCSESPNFIPPAAAPLGFYKNKVSLKFQGPSSPVIVWAAWNPGKGMYPKCKGHPVPVSRPQRFRETPAVGKRGCGEARQLLTSSFPCPSHTCGGKLSRVPNSSCAASPRSPMGKGEVSGVREMPGMAVHESQSQEFPDTANQTQHPTPKPSNPKIRVPFPTSIHLLTPMCQFFPSSSPFIPISNPHPGSLRPLI